MDKIQDVVLEKDSDKGLVQTGTYLEHETVMEAVSELANMRRRIAILEQKRKSLVDYLISTSPQYRSVQDIMQQKTELSSAERELKDQLGELAVHYREYSGQKKIAPGVEVADYVTVDYDEDEVVRYCLNNALAFVEMNWDNLVGVAAREPVNGDREQVLVAREVRDAAVRYGLMHDIKAFTLRRKEFDKMARAQADRITCVGIAYDPRPRVSSDLSMYETEESNE